MKKSFALLSVIALLIGTFALTGCKEKIKTIHGKVISVDLRDDTLFSMKVSADKEEYLFSLDEVQFNDGVMMKGDSVIVDYFKGNGDSLRAAFVTVLPKPARYLDQMVDSTKAVVSRPSRHVNK